MPPVCPDIAFGRPGLGLEIIKAACRNRGGFRATDRVPRRQHRKGDFCISGGFPPRLVPRSASESLRAPCSPPGRRLTYIGLTDCKSLYACFHRDNRQNSALLPRHRVWSVPKKDKQKSAAASQLPRPISRVPQSPHNAADTAFRGTRSS